MEVRARKRDFLEALYWTQSIVERRHTMPILANVLIESENRQIRVTATDLEVGVRTSLEGEVLKKGLVTLNAKKLYEIVREAPEESLQLRRLDNDWVEIKSGRSVFKMVGLDPREYPQFPDMGAGSLVALGGKVLREMIERTIFSVSTDETRHNLNGVFVEESGKDKLRMVATDGHRLALVERAVGGVGLKKGVILPRKGLVELKKLLEQNEEGTVSIGFKENMGLVARDNVELFMRLIDADFPDYSKVIPGDNPLEVKIGADSFLQALRRVSILSNDRYKGVKLELSEGKMAVSANNPDLGEAAEEIEVDYQGRDLALGFNARYLMDVLGVIGDAKDIELSVKDELSPGLLRQEGDPDYLYVVMPMRL
jgi:DNA polymerase-3 subunit beta